jgi:hypothetical protein
VAELSDGTGAQVTLTLRHEPASDAAAGRPWVLRLVVTASARFTLTVDCTGADTELAGLVAWLAAVSQAPAAFRRPWAGLAPRVTLTPVVTGEVTRLHVQLANSGVLAQLTIEAAALARFAQHFAEELQQLGQARD